MTLDQAIQEIPAVAPVMRTWCRGFGMGGDDHVTKPFVPEVLHQRILAVLRRTRGTAKIAVTRSWGLTWNGRP